MRPRGTSLTAESFEGVYCGPFRTTQYSCGEEDEEQKAKKKTYLPSMAFRAEKT